MTWPTARTDAAQCDSHKDLKPRRDVALAPDPFRNLSNLSLPTGKIIPGRRSWGLAGCCKGKALHFITQDGADSHRIGKGYSWAATGSVLDVRRHRRPASGAGRRQILGECVPLSNIRFAVESSMSVFGCAIRKRLTLAFGDSTVAQKSFTRKQIPEGWSASLLRP